MGDGSVFYYSCRHKWLVKRQGSEYELVEQGSLDQINLLRLKWVAWHVDNGREKLVVSAREEFLARHLFKYKPTKRKNKLFKRHKPLTKIQKEFDGFKTTKEEFSWGA